MATSERYISTNADIKVQRSRNSLTRKTKHGYFHGYLNPLGSPIEVLPGDTFKAKISCFTRMSTPIVPFIDDIREEVDAFFVPKRILWDKTKQFYGEAETFGVATKVNEPRSNTIVQNFSSLSTNILKNESIAAAFGLVNNSTDSLANIYINVNPIRALFSIYNEYFRDENYQNQYKWSKTQSGDSNHVLATLGTSTITGLSYLPQVNKDRDVITSILPYQIKGNPIDVQLNGDVIPVKTFPYQWDKSKGDNIPSDFYDSGTGLMWSVTGTQSSSRNGIPGAPTSQGPSVFGIGVGLSSTAYPGEIYTGNESSGYTTHYPLTPSNLGVEVSGNLSVSVANLMYAFAYQDFLARCAHFGTRMKEYIYSMFGCRIPDLSDDVPEYLGRLRFSINVQQVVQTTGFQPDDSTGLGSLGAYSNSGKYDTLFTKSFTEPGYIVLVFYTKHQRTYSSGVDRVFVKNELLDYYQPPFANIPDVPFGSLNVWLQANTGESDLGFQEPWWDYRALQDRTYGSMNPMVDTLGEIWTLAEKWTAKPTIASAFMIEDRDAISRTLITGVNGPDYLCDFLLELDATRVMPLYSDGRLGRF